MVDSMLEMLVTNRRHHCVNRIESRGCHFVRAGFCLKLIVILQSTIVNCGYI